jgi:CubicO group peptidase (beta-lactamase class C family)
MIIQNGIPVTMSYKYLSLCLKSSFLSLFLLICLAGFNQFSFNEVDDILKRNQKTLGGNLVTLVWKDSLIYKKEMGEYFTAKSAAPIGQASSWLATAVIMSFVEQGKLKLDDPVTKYIPIYGKYAKAYLTIRHCLSQTTGVENDQGKLLKMLTRKKFATLEEEVNALAAKEISNNPGQEFHYGSIGINIAARVVEIIGKKSFDRLAMERIFRPLRMRGTSFTDENGGAVNPSGGARSTPNDYLNFLIMMLNKGSFEGKRILSEESIAEMQKNQAGTLPVKFKPKQVEGFQYGLGEWIQEGESAGAVFTCPSLTGIWPLIDRNRAYAVVLFTNTVLSEEKNNTFLSLKEAIDQTVGSR